MEVLFKNLTTSHMVLKVVM